MPLLSAVNEALSRALTASLALHDAYGFARAGTLRCVGYKFGRWLDVDLVELTLPGPANPAA